MKLTNYKMPEELIARLDAESERSGVPKSEMVRRGVLMYLSQREGADEHRDRQPGKPRKSDQCQA
jgi:predicted DNA-binding protein